MKTCSYQESKQINLNGLFHHQYIYPNINENDDSYIYEQMNSKGEAEILLSCLIQYYLDKTTFQLFHNYGVILVYQMSNKKIYGYKLAKSLIANISKQVQNIKQAQDLPKHLQVPRLGIIMVGNNPMSLSFIKRKRYYASKAFIKSRLFQIPDADMMQTSQIKQSLTSIITKLNQDNKYHGILLQLPLHNKILDFQNEFLDLISPQKDVDCLGAHNRTLFQKQGATAQLMPCVIQAVLQMLKSKDIEIKNKKILIIGKGKLVGNPLYSLLSKQSQIKIVDNTISTDELKALSKDSDIIFSATGQQDILGQQDLKKGCVIIDIGCSPDLKKPGKIRGDFSEQIKKRMCSYYSPVPKGVGPMVVYSLIKNVYVAWKSKIQKP